jgi:hypothetical protein
VIAVPGDAEGITVTDVYDKVGHRGVVTPRVHFDGVRVRADNLIGQPGRHGKQIVSNTFSWTAALIGAACVGTMRAAFECALDFARTEKRLGRYTRDLAPLERLMRDAMVFSLYDGGNRGVRRRQLHEILRQPGYDSMLAARGVVPPGCSMPGRKIPAGGGESWSVVSPGRSDGGRPATPDRGSISSQSRSSSSRCWAVRATSGNDQPSNQQDQGATRRVLRPGLNLWVRVRTVGRDHARGMVGAQPVRPAGWCLPYRSGGASTDGPGPAGRSGPRAGPAPCRILLPVHHPTGLKGRRQQCRPRRSSSRRRLASCCS